MLRAASPAPPPPGEAALKAEKLELQLQTRKQAADVEMAQTTLQQQAAAVVSSGGLMKRLGGMCRRCVHPWTHICRHLAQANFEGLVGIGG